MDCSEHDVLAYMSFLVQHRIKLHSTNSLERLNKEAKRRANVVGIFSNEQSIVRLIGTIFLELHDEWQLQSRYMQVEAMADSAHNSTRLKSPRLHPRRPERFHLKGKGIYTTLTDVTNTFKKYSNNLTLADSHMPETPDVSDVICTSVWTSGDAVHFLS
jgi:hypothetical protein